MKSPITNWTAKIAKEPAITVATTTVVGFAFFLLQNYPVIGTCLLTVIVTLAFLYTGLSEFLVSPKISWRGVLLGCLAIAILFLLSVVWYSPSMRNVPPAKAHSYLALLWLLRVVVSFIAARFVIVNYRIGKSKPNQTELATK